MKKTQELAAQVSQLFASAKKELLANMEQKGIGAIIWDNATAGFHYIPEIIHRSDDE